MKHSIEFEKCGPYADSMTKAVETCVHCGFCLPACPTYNELGQEADSPRGRILLMKQVLEGDLQPENISTHMDRCLGCLACETACPSGVKYRDLVSPYRSVTASKKTFWEQWRDRIIALTLPYPRRFRWALILGKLSSFLQFLLPKAFRPMTDLIPDTLPRSIRLKEEYLAKGQSHCRVVLLAGCAQQVLAPGINLETIKLLNYCGADVLVPKNQACCGALAWHNGDAKQARGLAVKNFELFPGEIQWIVTNAAGCGSGMKEYELLFQGTDSQFRAKEIASKTVDVAVLLSKLGLGEKLKNLMGVVAGATETKVAYHDACHLSNGQNVRSEPRSLLRSLPGVQLCELPGIEVCCGSAGTFNIDQPQIAYELGRQKAEAIIATGAEYLVTGNIGCIVQIQRHLQEQGSQIKVLHLVEFLSQRVFDIANFDAS
ncbi:MAG: heterodisulfide reductase-related iron-sulfur binding cluster [Planctomycetota bacterium]|nr:heterodisulfide reductase-related iron-sulfur binding cluster [Planctomycetota bacterium]